jgi:glycine cleavage system H protein
MDVPKDLLYTEEHEWVAIEDDIATIGITDYAQGELGDIVFIEFPEIGLVVKQSDPFGSIEAVKAVEELYAPVSGEVLEINKTLEENFEKINHDPYGEGWIIKVKISDPGELDVLLTSEKYANKIGA